MHTHKTSLDAHLYVQLRSLGGYRDLKRMAQHVENVVVYELSNSHDGDIKNRRWPHVDQLKGCFSF